MSIGRSVGLSDVPCVTFFFGLLLGATYPVFSALFNGFLGDEIGDLHSLPNATCLSYFRSAESPFLSSFSSFSFPLFSLFFSFFPDPVFFVETHHGLARAQVGGPWCIGLGRVADGGRKARPLRSARGKDNQKNPFLLRISKKRI